MKKPLKPKRKKPGPPKPPLFPLVQTLAGRDLRDDGMAAALAGEEIFMAGLRAVAENLERGWTGSFEDIRQRYEAGGGLPPRKSGAWGGAAAGLLKAGLLHKLPGALKQSQIDSNHARAAMRYIRL
jgi:hypothetical protein